MKFRYTKTWNEILFQFEEVKKKCNDIIDKLQEKGISKNDPRTEGMVHVRQFCNTLACIPLRIQQFAGCRSNKDFILKLFGIQSYCDLQKLLEDFNKNAKCGFITGVQFALENCIGQIIEDKTGQKPSPKFKDKCTKIIKIAGMSDRRKLKLNRLMLLAYIRNTLHSGGIHQWDSLRRKIRGVYYTLKKGKKVDCATWNHIFFLLWHSLDLYERIFLRL
ncbi:MAG: hypothetical protein GWN67_04980 [Phycisphaerae bacterium]|nr:hypothetical protein [Phycisphaerae bacterium]NIP51331.1 hypothetical protein [Phycisphaerae bacterium]NIS50525.1 hypothetical protein [Phycisphaerae bacterium]NIU08260.1 hypothetical protein [Phycisphaerae bacterium]NIU55756.1 hypothetical protein [Phycisphaerae bacterium]